MDEKYLNMVFTEHTALRTLCAYLQTGGGV